MTRRLVLIGVVFCFLIHGTGLRSAQESSPGSLASSPPAVFLRSPYESLDRTDQLLENLAVKLQLLLGYRQVSSSEAGTDLAGLAGLESRRILVKGEAGPHRPVLELAAAAHPEGGFEILLFDGRAADGRPSGNPDLATAANFVQATLEELEEAVRTANLRRLAYRVYPLSYIHTDRAIALLKVLNYTTVEYSDEEAENLTDKIFTPIQVGEGRLPVVVKIPDSAKTSLLDPPPLNREWVAALAEQRKVGASGLPGSTSSAVPDIGGTYLHTSTSGEPQQRLLLAYDSGDPASLEKLLNLLREQIDVPARQIVIEALIIELNSDRLKDLGISFNGVSGEFGSTFGQEGENGEIAPFSFTFDSSANAFDAFSVTLQALIERGEADILSKPSVLVLDGRQARIQIGQQVPVVKSTSTQAGIISSVDYFPVGIVLNLRPRVSEDGSQITMQAETIVSAVDQLASAEATGSAGILLAPIVDNRQVQSFVRVSDNSPFIIGGLISTERRQQVSGIPLLSDIPGIGFLFRRTTTRNFKREVIVVLTPHVVPIQEKSFSYVIPKDSGLFDSFGHELFRNSYRLRGPDVFDLQFVYESNILSDLIDRVRNRTRLDPQLKSIPDVATLLAGGVPGEDILVTRMLWEIIDRTGYAAHVDPERIIFFEETPDNEDGSGFQLRYASKVLESAGPGEGVLLTFAARPEGTPDHPFVQPTARVSRTPAGPGTYVNRLISANRRDVDGEPVTWAILLAEDYDGIRVPPLRLLQGILTLKRILELNSSLPLTLKGFHVGRQITFPSEEELQSRFHVVDRDAARLFYEVFHYYPAFEQDFNRRTREVRRVLDLD